MHSDSSAVGSVPRSGRGGREFESPLSDKDIAMNDTSNISSQTNQPQAEEPKWFAMRATYRCELAMKKKLEDANMTCFIALKAIEKKVGLRKKRVWVPEIGNLIFVRAVRQQLQDFKKLEVRLQYICSKNHKGGRTPIVVPDKQMAAFIKLYESGNYEISGDYEIINSIEPGMQVRVKEGPFEGMVGTFQRIKGHRNKRFVISIDQVACISTTIISPNMVEILNEDEK